MGTVPRRRGRGTRRRGTVPGDGGGLSLGWCRYEWQTRRLREGRDYGKIPGKIMNILFVWTGVTSYMADCWRELSRREGVSLQVVVEQVASGRAFDAAKVLSGFDCRVVEDGRLPDGLARPDILFAVGWHSKVVREAVERTDWRGVPKVCCFDMPWRWSARCIAARFVLRG